MGKIGKRKIYYSEKGPYFMIFGRRQYLAGFMRYFGEQPIVEGHTMLGYLGVCNTSGIEIGLSNDGEYVYLHYVN